MSLKFKTRKFKFSSFSIIMVVFSLFASIASLYVVREQILANSHVMGQEIAANFAVRQTARIREYEARTGKPVQNITEILRDNRNLVVFSENRLPPDSYYYLCSTDGKVLYSINNRNLSLERLQPYVDHIFKELKVNMADTTTPNLFSITDLDGRKRAVYYMDSDRGWISVVTIPYDYLLADFSKLLSWIVVCWSAFLIIAICLGIRDYTLKKRMASTKNVIKIMSKPFLAIYKVNYEVGRYNLLAKDAGEFVTSEGGDYNELLEEMVEKIEPVAAVDFKKTFSLENIKSLVEQDIHVFGGDFQQRFGEEYKWVSVSMVRDDQYLEKNEAIFFFRKVNSFKLKELERVKLLEQALTSARESAQARNMFFSAMSHDMRAPLNGIIGMAELADKHQDDFPLVMSYVQKIKSSGKQLMTLINDILEMASLENTKERKTQETFALQKELQEQVEIFQAQAQLERKNFLVDINVGNEAVEGDLSGLTHIMSNLLSNALKYTKENGTVHLWVRRENSMEEKEAYYSIIVKDNGCGMSEQFLQKVFEPFERETRFGVPRVVGTGLGMPIVKSLVTRMNGTIHIDSEVDKGTCVIVSLPFNLADSVQKGEQPKLSDFAGKRILVVEDNDINMEIISDLLTMNGLEVFAAANGREAVDCFIKLAEHDIDMVLMDMQMPIMDGAAATRALRVLERADSKTVPVIALTASTSPKVLEEALQAGMNDYMVKPVQMNVLAEKMAKYIRKK